jgi:hypothetical protein
MENSTNNQEVIPVSGFTGINFKAVGKIMLSQGDTESLTIQADPETRERIHVEVKEGILWITQETDWKDWTGFRLIDKGMTIYHVTMKDITSLTISEVGSVDCAEIKSESLRFTLSGPGALTVGSVNVNSLNVEISGVGSVDVAGTCQDQNLTLSGAGNYQGSRMESARTTIKLSGVGNAKVWANESLDATISGAGGIEYYGNAKVNQKVSGLGVIKYLGVR